MSAAHIGCPQVKNTTDTGLPSVNTLSLRELCGKPGKAADLLTTLDAAGTDEARAEAMAQAEKACGTAFAAFGGGREGLAACAAIDALCESNAVEKLLSGFIVPLQARTPTPLPHPRLTDASSGELQTVRLCVLTRSGRASCTVFVTGWSGQGGAGDDRHG